MKITSKSLTWTISEADLRCSLESRTFSNTVAHSHPAILCEVDGEQIDLFERDWSLESVKEPFIQPTAIGNLQELNLRVRTKVTGIVLHLQFCLDQDQPLAYQRITVENQSQPKLRLVTIKTFQCNPDDLNLGGKGTPNPAFFSNGWQSWSDTRTYGLGDRQHTSNLGLLQNPMVVNTGTPQPHKKNHFCGDFFGILGSRLSKIGLLAGFLSQREQFGSLETHLQQGSASLTLWTNGDLVRIPPGESLQTDWAVFGFLNLNDPDPAADYFQAVAREHQIESSEPVPVGWCSWYEYYQNISEKVIRSNLKTVSDLQPQLPLRLVQIDDGFETYPGDWFEFNKGFPDGLKSTAAEIKAKGLTPGLWLAPFIVHPKAKLVKEHPDWLLRNKKGKPVRAGFVWNSMTMALDLTNPAALHYTTEVIRTAVQDWGFEYLKLDFLYAAALQGVYQDPTKTRAQVLREGLADLRKAAGSTVTMLACGCPLGSALGLFEAMRISSDVSGTWRPHFPPFSLLLRKEPHMPAARNALQNILTRAPLHRRWWINDPDCLLVRPGTNLSLAEVQTLATAIALTGGSLLLSDDLPSLTMERLRIAQVLLPVIDQRPWVIDWFSRQTPSLLRLDFRGPGGKWHLLAKFNWEDDPANFYFSPKEFNLPGNQRWWLREFWTGTVGQFSNSSPRTFTKVPAHGVRVAAVRPLNPDEPSYLGSDLHISQGMEITFWDFHGKEIRCHIGSNHTAGGQLDFYLPWKPAAIWVNGKPTSLTDIDLGIYSLHLENPGGKDVRIIG